MIMFVTQRKESFAGEFLDGSVQLNHQVWSVNVNGPLEKQQIHVQRGSLEFIRHCCIGYSASLMSFFRHCATGRKFPRLSLWCVKRRLDNFEVILYFCVNSGKEGIENGEEESHGINRLLRT